jgi:hypothetical protein
VNLQLRDFMDRDEGWGRSEGRSVYPRLLAFIESNSGHSVFRVSLKGVTRVDISFASETLVELARRYRGSKGFCFVDLEDPDMEENWDAAAMKKVQPITAWTGGEPRVLGAKPSQGTRDALAFALAAPTVRVAQFVQATPAMSAANASSKFKQLWEQGFLLRQESAAETGGVEFVYSRIF